MVKQKDGDKQAMQSSSAFVGELEDNDEEGF